MNDKNTQFAVDEITNIFDNARKNIMPASELDAPCTTAEFERKVAEHKALLLREPERLLNVTIEDIVAIYKRLPKSKGFTRIDRGDAVDDYFDALADAQARESV